MLHLAISLLTVLCSQTPGPPPEPSKPATLLVVTVHVFLEDEEGKPIGGIPIKFEADPPDDRSNFPCVLSNPDAATELRGLVASDIPLLLVTLDQICRPSNSLQTLHAFKKEIAGRALKLPAIVAIEPGKTEYDVHLRVEPSVVLTGRLLDQSGTPASGCVWTRTKTASMCGEQGVFTVVGAPKGKPFELWLGGPEATLPATKTERSQWIGDVVIDTSVLGSTVQPVLVPECKVVFPYTPYSVFLFRDDGKLVRKCPIQVPDRSSTPGRVLPTQLPPGRYFAIVEKYENSPFPWALLSLLRCRDGPKIAHELHIPELEVKPDTPTVFEIDVSAAWASHPKLSNYW